MNDNHDRANQPPKYFGAINENEKVRLLTLGIFVMSILDGESADFMVNAALMTLIGAMHAQKNNRGKLPDDVLPEFVDCAKQSFVHLADHLAAKYEEA